MNVFPDNDPAFDAVYAEEKAMISSAELIAEALEIAGVTQKELASRLGVTKSEITHRLRGERNITVRKLAATLHALDAELEMSLKLKDKPRVKSKISAWREVETQKHPYSSDMTIKGYIPPNVMEVNGEQELLNR